MKKKEISEESELNTNKVQESLIRTLKISVWKSINFIQIIYRVYFLINRQNANYRMHV